MAASELTFGSRRHVNVGHYHVGQTLTQHGLEGWTAQSDCSIRCPRGRKACEFVSPVLKGAEGLKSLVAALKAIELLGAQVNESCGVHVHVGWTGDAEQLDRLVTLVARHEKAIYATTGTKSRENGRYYGDD